MKKIILIMILVGGLLVGNLVYAEVTGSSSPSPGVSGSNNTSQSPAPIGKIQNPLKAKSVEQAILLIVDILIYVGVCFSILAIIWVGFMFVMAQGNDSKIKEAKTWFFYIIIGLAILISSKVIVEIVQNTLINAGVVDKNTFRVK